MPTTMQMTKLSTIAQTDGIVLPSSTGTVFSSTSRARIAEGGGNRNGLISSSLTASSQATRIRTMEIVG
jgi:hypothetical protein